MTFSHYFEHNPMLYLHNHIKYLILISLFHIYDSSATNKTYKELLNKPLKELTLEQRIEVELMRLNEMRAEYNLEHPKLKKLSPLKYSKKLEESSNYFFSCKKTFLDENKKFGIWMHFCDNGDDVFRRYEAVKIPWILVRGRNPDDNNRMTSVASVGENLGAVSEHTMYDIFEAWKKSPEHWKQIISAVHTHVGFGFKDEGEWVILVQDFAKLE